MKSRMGLMLGLAVTLAAMSESQSNTRVIYSRDGLGKKRFLVPQNNEVIPKGCKEWLFDKDGNLPNQRQIAEGAVVFRCIARTNTKAISKFNAWLSTQTQSKPVL